MADQLSLPGFDTAASPFQPDAMPARSGNLRGYMLFLALFPEAGDARRLARAAADLHKQHDLHGTPLSTARLHVTLHAVAGFLDTVPRTVVDAALFASGRVACPPLRIVFDHAMSFAGANAFVLRCSPGTDTAIGRLREPLTSALRRAGLRPLTSRTPHMTTMYDVRPISPQTIEPICWTATRYALILSHVGVGHHQCIASWALQW